MRTFTRLYFAQKHADLLFFVKFALINAMSSMILITLGIRTKKSTELCLSRLFTGIFPHSSLLIKGIVLSVRQ